MTNDIQQEFYEIGYGKGCSSAHELIARFEKMDSFSRVRRATELLRETSGHLLDVGCGSGPVLYQMRNQFATLTGIDIAESQLNRIRAWAAAIGQNVCLYRRNIDSDKSPIADNSVNAITCIATLEFVIDPIRSVKRMIRALCAGGVFVATVGNIVSWKNRMRVLSGREPRTTTFMNAINGGALHYFSKATFVRMLEQSGLVVDYVGCSGRWSTYRSCWPALLGGDILVRARKPLGDLAS